VRISSEFTPPWRGGLCEKTRLRALTRCQSANACESTNKIRRPNKVRKREHHKNPRSPTFVMINDSADFVGKIREVHHNNRPQTANARPAKWADLEGDIMSRYAKVVLILAVISTIAGIMLGRLIFRTHFHFSPTENDKVADAGAETNKADFVICAPVWERGVTSHVHLGPFPFARSTYNRTGDQDCLGIEMDSDGNILGNKKIVQLDVFLVAHNKLFITRLDDGYYVNIID
jgi:hypothetical protein